jgi:hypothetical protein
MTVMSLDLPPTVLQRIFVDWWHVRAACVSE